LLRAKIAVQADLRHLNHKTKGNIMSSRQSFLPKLIGFCGYATSGKNTAAEEFNNYLKSINCDKNYKIVGFADTLKGDIKPCIDFAKSHGIDTTTQEFKTKFRPMWVLWSRVAKDITGDKKIWVKRLFDIIDRCTDDFAICDVRYDYEIDEIVKRGGVVIFITRPNVTYANDEEKQSFEEIFKNHKEIIEKFTIDNNGSKKELGDKIFKRVAIYG